jgi:hypothetical protein
MGTNYYLRVQENTIDDEIINTLMQSLVSEHPRPWRYEFDWGHEVYAADNKRIACCMSQQVAEAIMRAANGEVKAHYNQLHIGKDSMGWTFSFQGYEDKGIRSYKDWLKILPTGKIFDEYGEQMSLEDFKKMIEAKRKEEKNHTVYCRVHHPEHGKDCWLDDEKNSFCPSEFS